MANLSAYMIVMFNHSCHKDGKNYNGQNYPRRKTLMDIYAPKELNLMYQFIRLALKTVEDKARKSWFWYIDKTSNSPLTFTSPLS